MSSKPPPESPGGAVRSSVPDVGTSTESRIAAAVAAKMLDEMTMVHTRLGFLITKVEVIGAQAEFVGDRMEARMVAAENLHRAQRSISDTLFKAAVALSTARVVQLLAPSPAKLVSLAVGAAVGCFSANLVWMALHSVPHALAMLAP